VTFDKFRRNQDRELSEIEIRASVGHEILHASTYVEPLSIVFVDFSYVLCHPLLPDFAHNAFLCHEDFDIPGKILRVLRFPEESEVASVVSEFHAFYHGPLLRANSIQDESFVFFLEFHENRLLIVDILFVPLYHDLRNGKSTIKWLLGHKRRQEERIAFFYFLEKFF
jgi:hypothetical protein